MSRPACLSWASATSSAGTTAWAWPLSPGSTRRRAGRGARAGRRHARAVPPSVPRGHRGGHPRRRDPRRRGARRARAPEGDDVAPAVASGSPCTRWASPTCSTARASTTVPARSFSSASCPRGRPRSRARLRSTAPRLVRRSPRRRAVGHGFVRARTMSRSVSRLWLALSACRGGDGDLPAPYRTVAVPEERLPRPRRARAAAPCTCSTAPSATGTAPTARACGAGLEHAPARLHRPGLAERTSPRRVFHAMREGSPAPRCRPGRALEESGHLGPGRVPARRRGTAMNGEGRRIEVRGIVQGVGFRPWVYRLAREQGIAGRVRNDADGVTIEAFGPAEALDALRAAPAARAPRRPRASASSRGRRSRPSRPRDFVDRREPRTRARAASRSRRTSPPAPTAWPRSSTPRNRRYRYPFTNCTNCGPRFTIARDVPYDRPAHDDGAVSRCARRASASTTTRPTAASTPSRTPAPPAGPRSALVRRRTARALDTADPIAAPPRRSARRRRSSPSRASAASTSPATPPPSAAVARCARASAATRSRSRSWSATSRRRGALARSRRRASARCWPRVERPIVLVPRRAGGGARAPTVAPAQPAGRPDAAVHAAAPPAARRRGPPARDDVRQPLGGADRVPQRRGARAARAASRTSSCCTTARSRRRCDDSVARVIAGAPGASSGARAATCPRGIPVRRALRAPGARVRRAAQEHVLPRRRRHARTSARTSATSRTSRPFEAFEEAIERMERFLGVRPAGRRPRPAPRLPLDALRAGAARARSRSPCSTTTRTSRARWPSTASTGPVIGVAYDGTGYGTDGTAWGGEILSPTTTASSASATFRPIRAAGGDRAIRAGLAHGARAARRRLRRRRRRSTRFPLFAQVPAHATRRSCARCSRAASTRRWPTASAATSTPSARSSSAGPSRATRARSRSSGTSRPIPASDGALPVRRSATTRAVRSSTCGPLVAAAGGRLHRRARRPPTISARFHNTLAAATAALVGLRPRDGRAAAGRADRRLLPERALAERVLARARPRRSRCSGTGEVPPGDGGLALGPGGRRRGAIARSETREVADVPRRAGPGGRGRRARRRRSTSGASAARSGSTSSTSRSRRATTSSTTWASRSAASRQSEIGETLALFETLLAEARRGRPDGRRRAGRDRTAPGGRRREPRGRPRRPRAEVPRPGAAPGARPTTLARRDRRRSAARPSRSCTSAAATSRRSRSSGCAPRFPQALNVIMGPGCPVCITDMPEVDEGVALARQGVAHRDLRRHAAVPGTVAVARRRAGRGRQGRRRLQRGAGGRARAADCDERGRLLRHRLRDDGRRHGGGRPTGPPPELLRALGAQVHPAGDGDRRRDAGDARRGVPRRRPRRHDHRLGHLRAVRRAPRHPGRRRRLRAARHPRGPGAGWSSWSATARRASSTCSRAASRREGNLRAQEQLWSVFRPVGGRWRGIAHVPNGNLRLRDEWAHVDARRRFTIDLHGLWDYAPPALAAQLHLRRHHGGHRVARPTARCSARSACPTRRSARAWCRSEGTCRIWHQYGGIPNLGERAVKSATLLRRPDHAEARRRRPRDARAHRGGLPRGLPAPPVRGHRAPRRWTTARRSGSATAGSSSRPTRTSSTRSSSPAATSAGSRSPAPSTTSR